MSPSTKPDIHLTQVVKQFEGSAQPTLAGVDLRVEPGQIHMLLGYSGSGKSVTLKIILGLLKADRGGVQVLGVDIDKSTPQEIRDVRKNFGMLFQSSALFDSLSVFDNVAFPIREHRRDLSEQEIAQRVGVLLERVELSKSASKMPEELSGGMKKRVGLARAIALDPKILLFDEPTTGLDPVTSQIIDNLILRTTRDLRASALIISHNIVAAMRIADCVSMIAGGTIVETGPPAQFMKSNHETIRHFLESAGISL